MRVSRSATGSVMLMCARLLPARLHEPGDLAAIGHFADLGACQAELAVHAARTTRHLAAVAAARGARIPRLLLQLHLRFGARFVGGTRIADQLLELRTLRGVLLHGARAALLAFDHACLGHALESSCARYLRNGKLKASSSARPCSLVVAVVVMVMSMPRSWSIWSYWISGKMICSFTPSV